MKSVCTSSLASQRRTSLAVNSLPLSDLMFRRTMESEQLGQAMQDIVGLQLARRDDGETLAGELVDDSQHTECPSVLRSILDEIISPDMAGMLRSKTDAGTVVQPETAAFGLFLRHSSSPSRRQMR